MKLDRLCTTIHNTKKLKEMILEYPDLPLVVFAGEDSNIGDYTWMCCTDVRVKKGEILICNGPNDELLYTDRSDLRDDVEEAVYDEHEGDEMSDEELEKVVEQKMKEYEEYWTDCILLYVTN